MGGCAQENIRKNSISDNDDAWNCMIYWYKVGELCKWIGEKGGDYACIQQMQESAFHQEKESHDNRTWKAVPLVAVVVISRRACSGTRSDGMAGSGWFLNTASLASQSVQTPT